MNWFGILFLLFVFLLTLSLFVAGIIVVRQASVGENYCVLLRRHRRMLSRFLNDDDMRRIDRVMCFLIGLALAMGGATFTVLIVLYMAPWFFS